ncbi:MULTISPECIES: hypothetical protein [unclassified Exiguobacterium]|nr:MULTISPECIES: hypothetical protein [unclassified Exiguobacterium]
MRYREAIRSRFPVSSRLQSGNLPRRYSKAAGSRPIAFRFKSDSRRIAL